MTTYKRIPQYARPLVVSSLGDHLAARHLERVQLFPGTDDFDAKYQESSIQRLLYLHPDSLPVEELEPGLGRVIAIGMELPTQAGPVDNLFVTPEGNLVVVECKLWRNRDARRRVLAQIIDYAQGMSKWNYGELDAAVKRSVDAHGRPVGRSLIDMVRASADDRNDIDEARFIDAVQRNLRMGRMLLLIVGDGIREDTESLVDYLQMHAGFHFTLGLVEMAIYKLPSQEILVQPRILARTLNIERAIVSLSSTSFASQVVIGQPPSTHGERAMSLTDETFFERLSEASPEAAGALKHFSEVVNERGVFLDVASKSATLRWESGQGKAYSLGGIDLQGRLSTYSVCWTPQKIGRVDLGHRYLADLSLMMGAQVKQTKSPDQWYIVKAGTSTTLPQAIDALRNPEAWSKLVDDYLRCIAQAEGDS